MASGLLPKSPVSSSLCDEVPYIFIPKSHLEPREFLISSAKRLLQQYRHLVSVSKVVESYESLVIHTSAACEEGCRCGRARTGRATGQWYSLKKAAMTRHWS